jgi:hypothetical protein
MTGPSQFPNNRQNLDDVTNSNIWAEVELIPRQVCLLSSDYNVWVGVKLI